MTTTLQGVSFTSKPDETLVLSGGTYMITDPCYVLDDIWDELCKAVFCTSEEHQTGVLLIDDFKIWWGSTTYGDGGFQVVNHHLPVGEFGVDAGMFAIFPIEFIKKYKPEWAEGREDLAVTLEMDGGLVEYSGGNMDCGTTAVCTDGTDMEEEEEDDRRDLEDDEEENDNE